MIKKTDKGYVVYSEKGKPLSKPYKTKLYRNYSNLGNMILNVETHIKYIEEIEEN